MRRFAMRIATSIRPAANILIAAAAVVMLTAVGAHAEKNLLNNGDFARGSGNSVDGWRNDAWILTPGTTEYHWIAPRDGKPAEIELDTKRDNDARWVQTLSLR